MMTSTNMSLTNETCQLVTFFLGITQVSYMHAPVGDCQDCCPYDNAVDVEYLLYTRSNSKTPETIQPFDASSLSRTSLNNSNPVVIYVFGFSEAVTGPSTTSLKNAFLTRGDYNFIAVNWSRLVVFPWYISAVRNARYMGQQLADFIEFLNGNGIPVGSLHVIGFSLGAEAAGFAGKALNIRGLRIGRITGLDPAYPGYSLGGKDGHLSKGDAVFVDVLHSNPGVFGFLEAIGDVDFYPNPGSWIQPGCWIDELLKNKEIRYLYGCSHNRAWRLFAESILNPTGFPATLCRDWTSGTANCPFTIDGYMGFGAQPPLKGKMYLETNETPPFAKGRP